ncbi:MAG: aminotransferase class I/II-fold pyridoxal phosphate-dependent enzyme [Gammaproteobacteria bacterium]
MLSRLASEYHWQIEPDWLVWLPGLVCGLNVVSRAIGEAGCDILTAVPVYQHLFDAAPNVGKQAVCAPLARDGARWTFDFDALEQAITPNTRLFMLCNPHNPVGRMWDREELLALAEFCERHDSVICSDEIHCQLVLDNAATAYSHCQPGPCYREAQHHADGTQQTYNLPGLGCAFAIIPDPQLRAQIMAAKQGIVAARQCAGLYRNPGGLSRQRRLAGGAAGLLAR